MISPVLLLLISFIWVYGWISQECLESKNIGLQLFKDSKAALQFSYKMMLPQGVSTACFLTFASIVSSCSASIKLKFQHLLQWKSTELLHLAG